MKTNALILVDIQNDFVPGGALAVPEEDQIVPTVNRLQQCFDLIVATRIGTRPHTAALPQITPRANRPT